MNWFKKLFFTKLKPDDVEWVVNDMSELGVKIGDQFFFLYKGHSYLGGEYYRHVGKREFGECCHPYAELERKILGSVERRSFLMPDSYVNFHGEGFAVWKKIK